MLYCLFGIEVRESASPLERVVGSTILGSKGFVVWAVEHFVEGKKADREVPAVRALARRPTIEMVRGVVGRQFAGDARRARQVAMYLCHRYGGRRLGEVAVAFGVARPV